MTEKAFRLDFVIAVAALVMSVITTGALVYQTRVIHDQYAVALWPYIAVDTSYGFLDGNGLEISLINDGFGPAMIHSAQLSVDGKPVPGWREYGKALLSDPDIKRRGRSALRGESGTATSVDSSTIVRSGQTMRILRLHSPFNIPQRDFTAHKIALDFCYCSLNDSCWTLHATSGAPARPVPVTACVGDAAIASDFN